MTEKNELNTIEKKTAAVENWINRITTEGKVDKIDSSLVREVLESFGANFEISEEARTSLGKYSNRRRRPGMDAVWGKGRVDEFKNWLKQDYIPDYEKRKKGEWPTLYDLETKKYDTIKHSGMFQFFGEITSFAAGEKPFKEYKELTEDRARKGRNWELYKYREHSWHAPFPPEFPAVAWKKIKS
jgi:hypothetical protein